MELPESSGCFMATSMTQPGPGVGTAPLKVDWSIRDRHFLPFTVSLLHKGIRA